MAQLKSTTISGNLVVNGKLTTNGDINCNANYWSSGSINGNGWYNGVYILYLKDVGSLYSGYRSPDGAWIVSAYTSYDIATVTVPYEGWYIIYTNITIKETKDSRSFYHYVQRSRDKHQFNSATQYVNLGFSNVINTMSVQYCQANDALTVYVQCNYVESNGLSGKAYGGIYATLLKRV